ncbi:hypothetical protein NDU88_012552 [Pleurodeles waltl]|uniref:Uncharacterized protein n=1 Tax=Pleurodeles waltl TaxID=8319 RepID=A0AAV7R292_PLEWA|nr:hypothetical protein NDU88_012552 [Pleurodeles waltl]
MDGAPALHMTASAPSISRVIYSSMDGTQAAPAPRQRPLCQLSTTRLEARFTPLRRGALSFSSCRSVNLFFPLFPLDKDGAGAGITASYRVAEYPPSPQSSPAVEVNPKVCHSHSERSYVGVVSSRHMAAYGSETVCRKAWTPCRALQRALVVERQKTRRSPGTSLLAFGEDCSRFLGGLANISTLR